MKKKYMKNGVMKTFGIRSGYDMEITFLNLFIIVL